MPIDPICGMDVPVTSPHYGSSGGEPFYFCSLSCREKFLQQEKSTCCSDLADAKKAFHIHGPNYPRKEKGLGDMMEEYTCPMHPEIVQQGPGDCPKCGMALEPKSLLASLQKTESEDVTEMRWRFWLAGILSLPVFLMAMLPMVFTQLNLRFEHKIGEFSLSPLFDWCPRLEFVLTTAVLIVGWPLWKRGLDSYRSLHLNMFSLILVGVSAAYGLSVYELLASLSPKFNGPPLLYFESAATITTLTLLGQFLEGKARHKTADALRSLLKLVPQKAHRREGDAERLVPVSELKVDDVIRIYSGEAIPVDGEVVLGRPDLNEATLTGESTPVEKNPGDAVSAGTLNLNTVFQMRATQVGENTRLAQIVSLVAAAQKSRAPIQSLADRISTYFVPAIFAVSLLTFLVWTYGLHNFNAGMTGAVGVLIIACPCALGLATPMSLSVGLGRGAQRGVLVSQAAALEKLARARIIALDKTGTLTEGKPSLQSIEPGPDINEVELLTLVAGLEQDSEHPLAYAILKAAKERHLDLPRSENARTITGGGIEGRINSREILIGKRGLLVDRGIQGLPPEHTEADAATEILVSRDLKYAGRMLLADPIKKDAKRAMEDLRAMDLKLVLVTGDRNSVADALSRRLRFDEVYSNVSPEEKGAILKRLRKNQDVIAMVGDGVNDAPALALADVGIAMGLGADVAKQTAGLILMHSDLKSLVSAVQLSRAVLRNIQQNLAFAFLYNLIGIPLASGVVLGFFFPHPATFHLTPMLAALAMSLSSVGVITNALRLRWIKL